jgi:hypothetical protein
MENKIQKEENSLLNAFEIQILEERLEMAPWSDPEPTPPTGPVIDLTNDKILH